MSTVLDWLEGKNKDHKWLRIAGAIALLIMAYLLGRESVQPPEPTADYASLDQRIEEMQATIAALPKLLPVSTDKKPTRPFGSLIRHDRRYSNIRAQPHAEAAILRALDTQTLDITLREIYEQQGDWLKIAEGWIHSSLVELD